MLAVSFYKSSSEVDWAFGQIVENDGGILFHECLAGNKSLVCTEINRVLFLSTRVLYRLMHFKFPEGVEPGAGFEPARERVTGGFLVHCSPPP